MRVPWVMAAASSSEINLSVCDVLFSVTMLPRFRLVSLLAAL